MIPRVTLDDLFPRARHDYEPYGLMVFKAPGLRVCWVCGYPTHWVSLSFEAPICSMVCENLAWSRYVIADAVASGDPLWVNKK